MSDPLLNEIEGIGMVAIANEHRAEPGPLGRVVARTKS